ncbi:MAG: CobQ/CobB/MinD/ParA nucleotide binding domain protein [Actinobacteria bacterium ADurb.Bin346]|nr:MAG: CobQ/CobB/MinD/ParA nucleotide binding domain protein [Actinobacteria bacterium ADurb.Bin346]
MKKIPVVIIDRDEKNVEKTISILELLPAIGATRFSHDIYDLEMVLVKKIPTIVIIGPNYGLEDLQDILMHYSNSLSSIKIILLSKSISAELLKSALKLNIHDVLEYPFHEKDLHDSFNRAESIFTDDQEKGAEEIKPCEKIMFFSTKGGAGNTFLAVNFAIALKVKTKKEVALFDMNFQFGDVALMLNIYPKNTIFDLIAINKYDPENLGILLTPHSSGIKILPSPIDPSQGESISIEASLKVFEGLTNVCDYMIIDSPFGFKDSILSIMDKVDHMFLVATKDVPSIKNLKICIQLLERLSYPREKTYIILNRADSRVDFEVDEIEKTIQRKIDIQIPSDRMVPVSVNKGVPIISSAPRSSVGSSLVKMIDIILPKKEKIKV